MSDTSESPGNGAGVIRNAKLHNAGAVFAEPQTLANLPKTSIATELAPRDRAPRVTSSEESFKAGLTRERPETTIPFRDSSFFQLTGDTQ